MRSARGLTVRGVVLGGAGMTLDEIVAVIGAHRFNYSDEDQLQEALAGALRSRGFTVEREAILNARDRIDLLVARVGIEVKVASDVRRVRAQITRYCASDLLDGLVLVTNRARHAQLAGTYNGKPVAVASLIAGGL